MDMLKKHAANENMDDRSRQPDLNLWWKILFI